MKPCFAILLASLCCIRAELPQLRSQEAELLKKIENLPPVQAIQYIEGHKPASPSAALCFSFGALYYQAELWEQARQSFLRAVELAPDFDAARLNAAKVMMREQLYQEAVPHLVHLLSGHPQNNIAELWLLLAQCRLKQGQPLAAEKAVSNAIAFNSETKEAQLLLLQAIAAQPGRLDEASSLARQLLKGTPRDSRLWSIWASAELEAEHPNKAMDILETAKMFAAADLPMQEALLDLTVNRGFAHQACQLALEMHDQGILTPKRAQTAIEYLQEAGQPHLARALLDATATILPENALVAARSKQAALEGDRQTAIRLLRETLVKEPLDGKALLILADLLEDKSEGDALLERALLLPEFKYHALLKLATRAVEAKRYPQALQFALQARQLKDTPELERFTNQIRNAIRETQE